MTDVDINKYINDARARESDPEGHMLDLEQWTEDVGLELAKKEGLEMNDKRWEVVRYLRERYREHGQAAHAREVLEDLEMRYIEKGGKKYLYHLFPNGPVSQGSRIAGLPLPAYSSDPSFGTVE